MIFGQLALIVFAGAAVYIKVAEQPARLNLDERALRKHIANDFNMATRFCNA